jgi:hypothetical protein
VSDPLAAFAELLEAEWYNGNIGEDPYLRLNADLTGIAAKYKLVPRASGVRVSEDAGLRSKPWLVTLTCCGRADGVFAADSWEEAQAFREAYTSGPGISGGHVGDSGHARSAVIVDALAALRSEDAAPTCCELACYEDPGCTCDGCRSEDAAPQPADKWTEQQWQARLDQWARDYPPGTTIGQILDGTVKPTAHPSPADAPSVAPQSLRDAAQEVVEAWDNCTDPRVNNRLTLVDYDRIHDDAIAVLRAALDAPALTVERLAEALTEVQGGRYESWLKRAPLILRALGEGTGE